ncbi:MAG: hypothetical protein ACMUIU_10075 [bacterium]
MKNDISSKLKVFVIVVLFVISSILLFGGFAHTFWDPFCSPYLPDSLCYIYWQLSSYYTSYGYFNSINGYLLGYAPFTPFLIPDVSAAYNLAGIPTYPYFGSPYQTTFPYQTSPGPMIPHARFDYPTYVYGSPDFYHLWVLLQ